MRRAGGALVAAVLLLLVLLWMVWKNNPRVSERPALPVTPALPKPRPAPQPDTRVGLVEKILKSRRAGIAACLRNEPEGALRDLRLTVIWSTLGKLERVRLSPNLGQPIEQCIHGVLKDAQIPPAPDLAPLSVTQRLKLGLKQ